MINVSNDRPTSKTEDLNHAGYAEGIKFSDACVTPEELS
eukprot:SAG31_NODE_3304_length_4439_cov_2.067742_1_plen_39_part_00